MSVENGRSFFFSTGDSYLIYILLLLILSSVLTSWDKDQDVRKWGGENDLQYVIWLTI